MKKYYLVLPAKLLDRPFLILKVISEFPVDLPILGPIVLESLDLSQQRSGFFFILRTFRIASRAPVGRVVFLVRPIILIDFSSVSGGQFTAFLRFPPAIASARVLQFVFQQFNPIYRFLIISLEKAFYRKQ